jgi:hypothetical protein
MEDMCDIKRVLESQVNTRNKVEVQSKLESRSLILSPNQSLESPCLQINVQDSSNL